LALSVGVFRGAGESNVPILFFSSQADSDAAGGRAIGSTRSGNDVGCDLVFDERDAIAQQQFAFLQPL